MSTVKKIVIGVFAVILVFGAVAGGAVYFKKSRQETVPVVQVESIASDYYTDDTMLGRKYRYQCDTECQCR